MPRVAAVLFEVGEDIAKTSEFGGRQETISPIIPIAFHASNGTQRDEAVLDCEVEVPPRRPTVRAAAPSPPRVCGVASLRILPLPTSVISRWMSLRATSVTFMFPIRGLMRRLIRIRSMWSVVAFLVAVPSAI